MNKLRLVLGLLLAAALLAAAVLLAAPDRRAGVIEWLTGESPQARLAAYARAVARGDTAAALAAWELPGWELPEGRTAALRLRRASTTGELIALGAHQMTIQQVEWWSTCCEPHVTIEARQAGGARLRVSLLDGGGAAHVYIFDIFNRGGTYWGAALGYPPRHWALYDVYPAGGEPLFWRLSGNPDGPALP